MRLTWFDHPKTDSMKRLLVVMLRTIGALRAGLGRLSDAGSQALSSSSFSLGVGGWSGSSCSRLLRSRGLNLVFLGLGMLTLSSLGED